MADTRASSASPNATDNARPVLLLVDDDPLITETLAFSLEDDFRIHVAASREQSRALLQQADPLPVLALVDLGLPPDPHSPEQGFKVVSELLAFNPAIKILILSGQSERANIQHALTLGAVDFIPKPTDVELLRARLRHQLMLLEAEQGQADVQAVDCGLLGGSPVMDTLRAQIAQFADTPFPVLVDGESGSGKELVAECLHQRSQRAAEPYLTLNCAAISADLLEAQLFGHAKGAYTGAGQARAGFFEEAGAGTLLLDEIGEFPLALQPKLLRVLENGEYYRLAETRPRQAHARIIAATNRDLKEEVRAGNFREDLYHRLSVLSISVPPLRERNRDGLELLTHFRQLYAANVTPFALDQDAEDRLTRYRFPGNVRELRNIVIRLGAKFPGQRVGLAQLEMELESGVLPHDPEIAEDEQVRGQLHSPGFHLDEVLADWERRYINAALKYADGNLSEAARMLGVNRTTLYSRVQRLKDG